MIKTHILIASDDDYSFIRSNRKGSYKTPWKVPKIATPGDNAILFHQGAGFVATAEIMTSPKRSMFRNQIRYKADIQAKNISPVAFATIIKKVPNWKWTNYPRGYTTIEGDIEKRVWDLIGNQHSDKQRSPKKPRAAAAYLFLWNPKKDSESFEDYDQVLRNAAAGKSYITRWICPSIKPIAGDLAIVQRTGNTNNGVFAMGHVTHAPFDDSGTRVVGLKLDSFLPIGSEISRMEIVKAANYKKNWTPMASGNIFPDQLLDAIRSLWAVHADRSNTEQVPTSKPNHPPVIPPVIHLTPVAFDIKEPLQPDRVKQETYRILRDTSLARSVKEENQYRCQLCGAKLELNDKTPYAEAHHVKPLGAPHNGPDVRQNILCVCPNHHALLDYGAIQLDESRLAKIEKEYIRYHNGTICKKVS